MRKLVLWTKKPSELRLPFLKKICRYRYWYLVLFTFIVQLRFLQSAHMFKSGALSCTLLIFPNLLNLNREIYHNTTYRRMYKSDLPDVFILKFDPDKRL